MKDTVIIDIDGTISRVGDRLKYLMCDPVDWDSFYDACDEDEPILDVIDVVNSLQMRHKVVFCTGRRESVRKKTWEWIHKHVGEWYDCPLLMRKDGDKRHDTDAKPEMLREAGISVDDVVVVIEDRNSMVAEWRKIGFTVMQPAMGDF